MESKMKKPSKNTTKSLGISLISGALLAVYVAPTFADEDEKMTVQIARLSSEAATAVAQGAMLDCRKKGYQATATVVDKNGIVQAVVRDTLAPPVSIPISKAKAYTAINFSADTSAMASRANTAVGMFDGVLMSAGGVVINVGGKIYGAVGVSGAPGGDIDEACAKAGIEAISEDLEMAD